MKKSLYLPMAWLFLTLGACKPDKPGTQIWMYTSDFDRSQEHDTLLTNASFLDLGPDGRFTQDFGRFEYGTWNIQDQRLYLTDQHRKTYVYRVADLQKKTLFLQLGEGNRVGGFRGLGVPPGPAEKDPFSVENNQWRIRPMHRESDAELRQRLVQHCRFWERYFTWTQEAGIEEVEVRDVPTSLKVYANGFGIKHFDDQPAEWKSFFYDERDCRRADSIIKHAFRTHDIVWPKTDDDVKKLISGCQQVQRWLQ
ncbi:MAG TPA: hypothetical protein VHE54_14480 [Puia sp.]|nr:hypothetical protein [Puia sp.]